MLRQDRSLERVSARVSELQADQQVVVAPVRSMWADRVARTSRPRAAAVAVLITSWRGLARPSGTTAHASPQMSLAPPAPKRRKRRKVSSPGEPSSSASHPSIGWIARRLPTVRPPIVIGWSRGDKIVAQRNRGRAGHQRQVSLASYLKYGTRNWLLLVTEMARHAVRPSSVRERRQPGDAPACAQ